MSESATTESQKLILYNSAGARGLRVLWTIEELGLDCDLRLLPFPPRTHAPAFREVNPLGTVPALVDGDVIMTESSAIAHYLATRYGPSDLAVSVEERDYPMFLDFLHYADATITFPQTVYLRFSVLEPNRGLEQAGALYADWFSARLVKLEHRLADREFLCAERFTIADIAVTYALFLADSVGLGERLPPRARAYRDRLATRPALIRARAREKAGSA